MRCLIIVTVFFVAYAACESCQDTRPNCPSLKDYCNEGDVKRGCPKSCGVCVTDTPFQCVDQLGFCPNYVAQCHDMNIAEKCPKTCKVCGTTSKPIN